MEEEDLNYHAEGKDTQGPKTYNKGVRHRKMPLRVVKALAALPGQHHRSLRQELLKEVNSGNIQGTFGTIQGTFRKT
jgi:hypothetical protein